VKTEAIVRNVQFGSERTVGESLKTEVMYVSFQVLASAENQGNPGNPKKATIESPQWLAELEPAAPVDGYLMEGGEFSAELASDPRLKEGLRVTVKVND
jgi:hypothetical protein